MPLRPWTAFAAALLSTLAAHAAPLPFAPGERLGMEVSYLGMTVGDFDLTVASDAEATRPSWPVTLDGRTRGLFDKLYRVRQRQVSHFDPALGRSTASEEHARSGDHREETHVRLLGKKALVARTVNGRASRRVADVAPDAQDVLGAVYRLRVLPLKEGQTHALPVFTGTKAWTLEATVTGREKVKTDVGVFDAWRLTLRTHFDGKLASDRVMHLWLSADERRLIVRADADVRVGSLKIRLVAYDPPGTRTATR